MKSYEEIKEKLAPHQPKIVLGACFILVFIIGFGTGKYSQENERLKLKAQSNYTTSTVKKQVPVNVNGGEAGTVKGAVATSTSQVVSNSCIVKGNIGSGGKKIYHIPGGASYKLVKPEQCFATESEAQSAGYTKAGR